MFKKDDYVVYEASGVCMITDIAHPDFETSTNRQYYYLEPLYSACDCIYLPTEQIHRPG